ncbi:MAG: rod shape-determining protein MreD [Sphingomonadaceae bacterium]
MKAPLPFVRTRRSRFDAPPGAFEQQAIPVASVMITSLAPLLPVIVTMPIVPPLGFMMLLAWRLMRTDLWPAWGALPLGLFDDLFSGQPIGSAMASWTLALIAIDMVDTRAIWRDYRQDWALAAALIVAQLLWSLVLAGGGMSPILLVPQMLLAILAFPMCARIAAALDRWRIGA